MKASLKSIDCMHHNLNSYSSDVEDICITLSLSIGPDNSEGSEYFDLYVCSPEWLSKHIWKPELIRHTLLVRRYDLDEIKKIVNDTIEKCEGNDWPSISQKLSRYFAWEFEDYSDINGA